MVDLERNAAMVAQAVVDTAMDRADTAEARMNAWWRSPVLWVGVGVVIAIVLEVAAVAVLSSI
jgi:hypothetical protein